MTVDSRFRRWTALQRMSGSDALSTLRRASSPLTLIVIGLAVGASVALAPTVVLLAAGALVLATIAIWYPGVLLALYLVVPPFFKAALQPHMPIDLTVLLAALCIPQVLAILAPGHRVPIRGFVLWALLAALVAGGTTWSIAQGIAWETALYWFGLGFAPLLAAYRVARSSRHIEHFVRAMLVAGLTVVTAGLLGSGAVRLEILDANAIGAGRAALLIPILALTWTSPRRIIRIAAIAATPAAFYVALASGSRGPIVAFLAVAAVVGLFSVLKRDRLKRVLLTAGVAVIAYLGLQFVLPEVPTVSLDRVATLGTVIVGDSPDVSVDVRYVLYHAALHAFQEAPLQGVGTGGFPFILSSDLAHYTYPHNVVLQFAAEFGLAGLLVFGSLVGVALLRRLPTNPTWTTIRVLALFFLINGLVSSDALENRLMWGTLVLLLAAPAHPQQSEEDSVASVASKNVVMEEREVKVIPLAPSRSYTLSEPRGQRASV
jgi:O-antigen ligase